MKVKVILNPYANRWKAQQRNTELKAALDAAAFAYDLVPTEAAQHGIKLAKTAVSEGYDAVIAAGGDGTISEVVNGLMLAAGDGDPLPLGILPMGSANDFSDLLGLPRDLTAATQLIAAGKTRKLDIGRVNDHFFLNNSAIGMEPMVTIESQKINWLSGSARYMAALVRALIRLRAWHMKIKWDNGSYEGNTFLLSMCNGPRTGGFPMAPGAELDDGLLDFVFNFEMPKRTLMHLLLKLMKGTHIDHPLVKFARTTQLTIECEQGLPLHADGEILGTAVSSITYQVLPAKIPIFTP
jgi:diacylglycerol kinase (ATP)